MIKPLNLGYGWVQEGGSLTQGYFKCSSAEAVKQDFLIFTLTNYGIPLPMLGWPLAAMRVT